ncbi:hypothetical protein QR680_003655 [Steinernema hermaphroditum]|uniref:Uncharacterized protein n=1 Tax=Steinernema hermaphroditum TaxID=289476 RepID=A0AA39HNC2_9BILA|nr:hypothetical protein QR680_003655 [Steinernema hermaphroditum]
MAGRDPAQKDWHEWYNRTAPLNTTTLILWSTYDRDNKLPINPHYCFENDKAKTILYVIFFPGITLLAIFGSFLLFAHYYLNDVVSQLM